MTLKKKARGMRTVWSRSGLTIVALVLLTVLPFFGSPVLAEQAEDEKRIEALEKELQEIKASVKAGESVDKRIERLEVSIQQLKDEVEKQEIPETQIKKAESEDEKPRGMTAEQKKQWKQKSAAAAHVNYNADWNRGTPQDYVVDKNWIGLSGVPTEVRLSGWVQAAVFTDFQEYGISEKQEFSAGAIPVPNNKESSTGMDASSSRIFFESRHLFKSKNVANTLFILDGGGSDVSAGYTPRFRQANVTLDNLTFGLANGTFTNGSTWPLYFDRGAPGAYPLARKAVMRYSVPLSKKNKKEHILTFGIEDPQSEVTNATNRDKWPDMVARYDFNPKWGNLMGGVLVQNLNADSTTTSASDEAWLWGAQVSGVFTFRPGVMKDHLKYGVFYGTALPAIMWDSMIGGTTAGIWNEDAQTIETQNGFGAWAGYEHSWSERWSSLFMASYADIDSDDINAADAFDHATTYTATLAWQPWHSIYLGLEYFYGQRWNFDGESDYNNRLNFVFRFVFNR